MNDVVRIFMGDPEQLTSQERYWRSCNNSAFDVQRLADRYVIILRSYFNDRHREVYEVIELPLDATDAQFEKAVDRAMHPVRDGFKTDRKLATRTRKLPYYRDIESHPRNDWLLRNNHGARHATIYVSVQLKIEVEAFWAYELKHCCIVPLTSDLAGLVRAIRQAFVFAEHPPETRFRYDTQVDVVRTDEAYLIQQLCISDARLKHRELWELPATATDKELGNALIEATTALPRLSPAEFEKLGDTAVDREVQWRSAHGTLFWDGARTPEVLSFSAGMGRGKNQLLATMPVDSGPAALGKLVRTSLDKVTRKARAGKISNRQLLARLQRLEFFAFAKNPKAQQRKVLDDGWIIALSDATGRCFHADQEDLAEGGVAELLKSMKPFFAAIGLDLGKVRDAVGETSYDLWIGKKRLPILMAEDFEQERRFGGYLWGIAAYRTSLVLNRLLRDHGRPECAYSVEAGNDHAFVLISPAMHAVLCKASGFDKPSGPYRATNGYPGFGLPSY